jgi:hypothetical protein
LHALPPRDEKPAAIRPRGIRQHSTGTEQLFALLQTIDTQEGNDADEADHAPGADQPVRQWH